MRTTGMLRALADLVVPIECGGCHRPGYRWCPRCATRMSDAPVELSPRIDVGVPVWALGRYRAPYATSVLAMKEHRRRDLAAPIGTALANALATLARWSELPDADYVHLVPAPTRTLAARRRGGDTVTAFARAAAAALGPRVCVTRLLHTAGSVRDSMGLDARHRASNMDGAIRMRAAPQLADPATAHLWILVDDVLTTGATAAESVKVLASQGIDVHCVVVIAGA